jgi:hypothetical protein
MHMKEDGIIKFKIGDRVRVIYLEEEQPPTYTEALIGKEFTVTGIKNHDLNSVNCGDLWFYECELELAISQDKIKSLKKEMIGHG